MIVDIGKLRKALEAHYARRVAAVERNTKDDATAHRLLSGIEAAQDRAEDVLFRVAELVSLVSKRDRPEVEFEDGTIAGLVSDVRAVYMWFRYCGVAETLAKSSATSGGALAEGAKVHEERLRQRLGEPEPMFLVAGHDAGPKTVLTRHDAEVLAAMKDRLETAHLELEGENGTCPNDGEDCETCVLLESVRGILDDAGYRELSGV